VSNEASKPHLHNGAFSQLVLQGKKEFVEDYSYGTPYWQNRTPKGETRGRGGTEDEFEGRRAVLPCAGAAHQESRGLSGSGEWYRSIITSFSDDPETAATNFLLADTLFESKQYLEAAQAYEFTAYGYGAHERAGAAGMRPSWRMARAKSR